MLTLNFTSARPLSLRAVCGRSLRNLLVVVILAVVATIASAQDTLRLALDSAITIALEQSKTLRLSQQQAEAAAAAALATRATQLPTVKAGASYARLSDVPAFAVTTPFPAPLNKITLSDPILNNYSAKLALEQPIFAGGRIKSAIAAQNAAAQAALADVRATRSELIYNVEQAYWLLFKAAEFKQVIDDNIATVDAHLKDVRNLVAQGLATSTDALAVEVQLSNVKLTQIDAADNMRIAAYALCNRIGLPLNPAVIAVTQPQFESAANAALPELESARTQAIDSRPELQAAAHRTRAAEAGVKTARAGSWPQLGGFANYYYQNPNQRYQPATDEWHDSWDIGVSASWTLWNWGATKQQTRQARAQHEQAQTALAAQQDAIRLEVSADLLHVSEARHKISVSADGAKLAEENYRATREKFKNGLARNSELLDAEDNLLRARWNQTQAVVDHQLALAKLNRSTGAR
jgi:outer membrane protein